MPRATIPPSSPPAALERAEIRPNVLRSAPASDATPVAQSGPQDASMVDRFSPVIPQVPSLAVPAAESERREPDDQGDTVPLATRPGGPPPDLRVAVRPPPADSTPATALAPADSRSRDDPSWITVGIAHFLGTLAGLAVGLPIAAAAAWFILSRLGSRSLAHLALLKRLGDTANGGDPAHTINKLTANQPYQSRQKQPNTAVADFADENVPFRVVGQTYDQQQAANEERDRKADQEILRKILKDNVALCSEISARRKVA